MADPYPVLGSPEWWMRGVNNYLERLGKTLSEHDKVRIVWIIMASTNLRIGLADVVNAVIAERSL